MTFEQLIDGVESLAVGGPMETPIRGVQYDSRAVAPGDCFVAIKGETTDGNRYINAALKAGAKAIVSDSGMQPPEGVAWANVSHGRRALARISANFYARPAERLHICGITGTNGKTTTAFLVEAILSKAGKRPALIGTIEYRIAGKVLPSPHTTPEALELQRFFSQALAEGVSEAVMEVSSHALEQERVFGLPFDVAVFTNLTRDHLDFHRDMESYFASKQKLFSGVGVSRPRAAIINKDDQYGLRLIEFARKKGSNVVTFGLKDGDFSAQRLEVMPNGSRFELQTPQGEVSIFTPLAGLVNVYNVLAASAAAMARGCTLTQVADGVRGLEAVPGRFERVDNGQPYSVIVDYAHTDDALRNLTSIAKDFVSRSQSKGRVITIFGCGGDRDRAKRPLMARAAAEGSDFLILTSDNPRSEDALAIIHDAMAGLRGVAKDHTIEPDRKRAISLAIRLARAGDIVLIAGKGHEKVQITRNGAQPFDDVLIARQALHASGFTGQAAPAADEAGRKGTPA